MQGVAYGVIDFLAHEVRLSEEVFQQHEVNSIPGTSVLYP